MSDVSEDLVNRFRLHLMKKGLNNNSIKKKLKSFKIFLNYCESKKYLKLNFDYSRIKIKTYDPTIVTLTEDEFQKFKDWPMKDEIITPYSNDIPLLKKLGLTIYSCSYGVGRFLGTVKNDTYSIDVWVTCMSAMFFRFHIKNHENTETF